MAADLLYDPATELWSQANSTQGKQHVIGYLWDTVGLQFVIPNAPPAGSGGNVNVTNFPATYAVTGTFWQATQPVSGPLTDTQLRASAVPVSGAFFQTTQPVSIAATLVTSEVAPTTVSHAVATVVTAGTRVQLSANTAKSIVVKAATGNTGTIYVGGSGVAAGNGFPLAAGDTVSLDISNTNVVWLDASINAQSVNWLSNN